MPDRAAQTTHLPVGIDRTSRISLERQLYSQIRDAILGGQIRPGARIPSTRSIALELHCSRNTIVGAIGLLLAEGYLEARHGSGTFVSRVLPEELMAARERATSVSRTPVGLESKLSERGEAMAAIAKPRPLGHRPFDVGVPDVELFPFPLWGRILGQVWRHPHRDLLSYGAPGGYVRLRENIADYLRQARGVHCQSEQIFITSGAQQAFDILARFLLDPGDRACVEDPGYFGSRGALAAAGARIVPLSVDHDGISLRRAPKRKESVKAVVVTPSHQFPLGVVMSLERRLELLDWAETVNAWVIEDDYDSEFRYSGPPLTSLQGLAAGPTGGQGRVVYVGSFSKVLFPGLRLGYMILPAQIADKFARARRIIDDQYPSLVQPVLAEFLEQGHFLTHVRRMRRVYETRQGVLIRSANKELSELLELAPHDAGLHLIADLKPKLRRRMSDQEAAARAASHGAYPRALSDYFIGKPTRSALLFGYAGMRETEIRKAVRKVKNALSPGGRR